MVVDATYVSEIFNTYRGLDTTLRSNDEVTCEMLTRAKNVYGQVRRFGVEQDISLERRMAYLEKKLSRELDVNVEGSQ